MDMVVKKIIPEFKKVECCKYICLLDAEKLKVILSNLKIMIDDLIEILGER